MGEGRHAPYGGCRPYDHRMNAVEEILALVQQSEAKSGTFDGKVDELEYLTTQILLALAKLALRIDALSNQLESADREVDVNTAKELAKLRRQVRKLTKAVTTKS